MIDIETLNIPKGQSGYLSKSDIAKILKDGYQIEYTDTQLKKTKREELVAELKDRISIIDQSVDFGKKAKKCSFRETLKRIFSRSRY